MDELHISDEGACKYFSFYTFLSAWKNSVPLNQYIASIYMRDIDRNTDEVLDSAVMYLSKEDAEKLRNWLNELLESE